MDKKCALFVDDNKVSQTVATALLNSMEMDVHAVDDCTEAISALERNRYQIVFFDCLMFAPEYPEIVSALKKYSLDIPIIGMVTTSDPKSSEQCLAAGMQCYINKPLERSALEEQIKKVLQKDSRPAAVPGSQQTFDKDQILNVDLFRQSFSESSSKELFSFFVDTAPGELRDILAAIDAADYSEARRMLHTFKGSCATIYAEAFAHACLNLEDALNNGREADIESCVGDLQAKEHITLETIKKYLVNLQ